MPQDFESPFLEVHSSEWIAANDLAFAIFDKFPVSKGHALVISKRLIATWFDASDSEQASMMALVGAVRRFLDQRLHPKPDGYNVGFNSGIAAGQTVPHLHIHVIPRYRGDVTDPTGGIRHVIPAKANYLRPPPAAGNPSKVAISLGHPGNPLWGQISIRLPGAREVDILACFVQLSGFDIIQEAISGPSPVALRAAWPAKFSSDPDCGIGYARHDDPWLGPEDDQVFPSVSPNRAHPCRRLRARFLLHQQCTGSILRSRSFSPRNALANNHSRPTTSTIRKASKDVVGVSQENRKITGLPNKNRCAALLEQDENRHRPRIAQSQHPIVEAD
jgi:diadenosine tetraphosphate (Ap4A) HIT family hydrolase